MLLNSIKYFANEWSIRYAGQLFQKQHPDVYVIYETNMDGDYAVSKENTMGYDKLGGQTQDVYWVRNSVGLCKNIRMGAA